MTPFLTLELASGKRRRVSTVGMYRARKVLVCRELGRSQSTHAVEP